MLKKLLVLLSLCCAALAYAAVDVNQASEAELDRRSGATRAETIRRDNGSPELRWLLLRNRQHQVVPVNHLGFSRVAEQLFKLRRRLAT